MKASFIMMCSPQKYCSMMWLMQSAMPARVCLTGRVNVYVGSMNETAGKTNGEKYGSLSLVSVREITAPMSYSEPVAARVMMSTMGMALSVGAFPVMTSHGSASVHEAPAIAFVQSSTLPPPTDSMTSMLCCLHIRTPSTTLGLNFGLGSMPGSS